VELSITHEGRDHACHKTCVSRGDLLTAVGDRLKYVLWHRMFSVELDKGGGCIEMFPSGSDKVEGYTIYNYR